MTTAPPDPAAEGFDQMMDDMQRLRRRMAAAYEAGRGCHLSAHEIQLLGLGLLDEWWSADEEYLRRNDHEPGFYRS